MILICIPSYYPSTLVWFWCSIAGNKYWSGLLQDYYGPRAAVYFKFLIQSLEKGDGFQLREWRREWIKLTNNWQSSRNVFPTKSMGNTLDISRWLYNKYLKDPESLDHSEWMENGNAETTQYEHKLTHKKWEWHSWFLIIEFVFPTMVY